MALPISHRLIILISLLYFLEWSHHFVSAAVINEDDTSFHGPPRVVRPNIYGNRAFPCRFSNDYSLCLDPPFDTYNGSMWCKARMCGSSYVFADPCPADDSEKADSLCAPSEQQREVIKCKAGQKPMEQYLPFECFGDVCTEKSLVCQCEYVNIRSVTLRKVLDYKSKYCY